MADEVVDLNMAVAQAHWTCGNAGPEMQIESESQGSEEVDHLVVGTEG